jgi:hypothetical protein
MSDCGKQMMGAVKAAAGALIEYSLAQLAPIRMGCWLCFPGLSLCVVYADFPGVNNNSLGYEDE